MNREMFYFFSFLFRPVKQALGGNEVIVYHSKALEKPTGITMQKAPRAIRSWNPIDGGNPVTLADRKRGNGD